jgi:nucleoside-diphosphate-sugar epimerase
MIIGNGQLAKSFQNYCPSNLIIFASGVSNSECTDIGEFNREKTLLIETLIKNKNKKFVYFSSCVLSAENYNKNQYYKHKANMEKIIKQYSDNYYIFRLPQLFGDLINHKTIINFIYKSIQTDCRFNVYDNAYRYVIEINDTRKIVMAYLKHHQSCIIKDIANTHRYKVLDIVQIFENLLGKKANYNLIPKDDFYTLELSDMENFISKYNIDVQFGENYLKKKLKEKLL